MATISRLTLLLLLVLPLLSCGDEGASDATDNGGELQTGSEQEVSEEIPTAEVDSIVDRYFSATDSLAHLFEGIESLDDVERAAPEISRLNQDIWEFNRLSVQYGQVLIDRMDTRDNGASLERLLNAREGLQQQEKVYERVQEIEAKTGEEVTDQDDPEAP